MISYAQNREDVLLERFFAGEAPQFYVDVGAGHPTFHSVTRHFYNLGWRGMNLEPRLALWEMLQRERPNDINLQCGASSADDDLTFYLVEVPSDQSADNGGLSTLDAALAAQYRERGYRVQEFSIPVRTLNSVFAEHAVDAIGFLKIDCEGMEEAVLRGLDLERYRPRVIVLESTVPTSAELSDHATRRYLEERGYRCTVFDGLNNYFVRREEGERAVRLSFPAGCFDDYCSVEEFELHRRAMDLEARLRAAERELAVFRGAAQTAASLRVPGAAATATADHHELSWSADGRLHLSADLFSSQSGRHVRDGLLITPGAGACFVIYGPYRKFPVGRYRAVFQFADGKLPAERLRLDITNFPGGEILVEHTCNSAADAVLAFEHGNPDAVLEFRALTEGAGAMDHVLFTGVDLARVE